MYSPRVIVIIADGVDAVVAGGTVQPESLLGIEPRIHRFHAHSPPRRGVAHILVHRQPVSRARHRARFGHDAGRAASSVRSRHRTRKWTGFVMLLILPVATIQDGTCNEGRDRRQDADYETCDCSFANAAVRVGFGEGCCHYGLSRNGTFACHRLNACDDGGRAFGISGGLGSLL